MTTDIWVYPSLYVIWILMYLFFIPTAALLIVDVWLLEGHYRGIVPIACVWTLFHVSVYHHYYFGTSHHNEQRHDIIVGFWNGMQMIVVVWVSCIFLLRVHPSPIPWWSLKMRLLSTSPFLCLIIAWYTPSIVDTCKQSLPLWIYRVTCSRTVWIWAAACVQMCISRCITKDANRVDYVAHSLQSTYTHYRIRETPPSPSSAFTNHTKQPGSTLSSRSGTISILNELVNGSLRKWVHPLPLINIIIDYASLTNQPITIDDDILSMLALHLWVNVVPPSNWSSSSPLTGVRQNNTTNINDGIAKSVPRYPPLIEQMSGAVTMALSRATRVPIWYGHMPYVPVQLPVKLHILPSSSLYHSAHTASTSSSSSSSTLSKEQRLYNDELYVTLDDDTCDHIRGRASSLWNEIQHIKQWFVPISASSQQSTSLRSSQSPPFSSSLPSSSSRQDWLFVKSLTSESRRLYQQIVESRARAMISRGLMKGSSLSSPKGRHTLPQRKTTTPDKAPKGNYLNELRDISDTNNESTSPTSSSMRNNNVKNSKNDERLPLNMHNIMHQLSSLLSLSSFPDHTDDNGNGVKSYLLDITLHISVWLCSLEGEPKLKMEYEVVDIHRRTCNSSSCSSSIIKSMSKPTSENKYSSPRQQQHSQLVLGSDMIDDSEILSHVATRMNHKSPRRRHTQLANYAQSIVS
jgi:hypothetical protein